MLQVDAISMERGLHFVKEGTSYLPKAVALAIGTCMAWERLPGCSFAKKGSTSKQYIRVWVTAGNCKVTKIISKHQSLCKLW